MSNNDSIINKLNMLCDEKAEIIASINAMTVEERKGKSTTYKKLMKEQKKISKEIGVLIQRL